MTMNTNIDNRFNEDYLALSDNYAGTMNGIVLPYINARRTDRTVEGAGGVLVWRRKDVRRWLAKRKKKKEV